MTNEQIVTAMWDFVDHLQSARVGDRRSAGPKDGSSGSTESALDGSETSGDSPRLSYRDLAWWAEAADGIRDVNVVIAEVVQNDGSVSLVVKKREDAQRDGNRIVVDNIFTESLVKGRPAPTRVTIEVNGQVTECRSEDGEWCDAVFCSESAMEKFLFPYYHSQRLLTDAEWFTLKAAFMSRSTIAIGHVHPSHPVILAGGGGGAGSFYGLTVQRRPGALGVQVRWESLLP